MKKSTLTIGWNLNHHPITSDESYLWNIDSINIKNSFTSKPKVPIDTTVIKIINFALEKSLSRKCAWNISEIPQDLQSIFITAASIYKRGVKVIGQKNESLATSPHSGSYQIHIVPGIDQLFTQSFKKNILNSSFIIIDREIVTHWRKLNIPYHVAFDASEMNKTPESVNGMVEKFLRLKNPSPWLVIGGGICCDTAAFACSFTKMPLTLIPTTLLSMIDSSIGGKTAVNIPFFGKNLIGSFYFPKEVFICPEFMNTLPEREFRSGMAEGIKHAMLTQNEQLFETTLTALKKSPDFITPYLYDLIKVKADIVANDPTENHARVTLNLGHTLGHALESMSHQFSNHGQDLKHGEAVALGLCFALQLSKKIFSKSEQNLSKMQDKLLKSGVIVPRTILEDIFNIPLASEQFQQSLLSYIKNDKKNLNKNSEDLSQWILLSDLGIVAMNQNKHLIPITEEIIISTWHDFIHIISLNK